MVFFLQIKAILKLLKEKLLPTKEKIIIVSQWTNLLRLLSIHLKNENISFDELNGKVDVMKRTSIVQNFNDATSRTKVSVNIACIKYVLYNFFPSIGTITFANSRWCGPQFSRS